MTDITINIVNAEVLTVGPDEVLIVHLTGSSFSSEENHEIVQGLTDHLVNLGLNDRYMIIMNDSNSKIELTKVKKNAEPDA